MFRWESNLLPLTSLQKPRWSMKGNDLFLTKQKERIFLLIRLIMMGFPRNVRDMADT